MSDEEVQEEIVTPDEEVTQASQEEVNEPVEQSQMTEEKKNDKMNKKFRLIKGEEILETKQPSFLAFFQYYLLGIIVFGVHFLYSLDNWEDIVSQDPGFALSLLANMMNNQVSFVILMLIIAWFNRMINSSTSNGWIGVWLMITALVPMFTLIDNTFEGADWYP